MRVKQPEQYNKAREDYLSGMSLEVVAERNCVAKHTVVNWYNRYGWREERLELQRRIRQNSIERIAERMSDNVVKSIDIAGTIIKMVVALLQTTKSPLDDAGLERIERLGRIAKNAISIQNEAEPNVDEAVVKRLLDELNDIKSRFRIDADIAEQV